VTEPAVESSAEGPEDADTKGKGKGKCKVEDDEEELEDGDEGLELNNAYDDTNATYADALEIEME
jgi:hypothetical protein